MYTIGSSSCTVSLRLTLAASHRGFGAPVCVFSVPRAADKSAPAKLKKVPDMQRANSSSSELQQARKTQKLRAGLGLLTAEQWADCGADKVLITDGLFFFPLLAWDPFGVYC